jgi:hypothetical protein
MAPQYHTQAETNELIAFSRRLDGDLYTVIAALGNDNATKSVKITFSCGTVVVNERATDRDAGWPDETVRR